MRESVKEKILRSTIVTSNFDFLNFAQKFFFDCSRMRCHRRRESKRANSRECVYRFASVQLRPSTVVALLITTKTAQRQKRQASETMTEKDHRDDYVLVEGAPVADGVAGKTYSSGEGGFADTARDEDDSEGWTDLMAPGNNDVVNARGRKKTDDGNDLQARAQDQFPASASCHGEEVAGSFASSAWAAMTHNDAVPLRMLHRRGIVVASFGFLAALLAVASVVAVVFAGVKSSFAPPLSSSSSTTTTPQAVVAAVDEVGVATVPVPYPAIPVESDNEDAAATRRRMRIHYRQEQKYPEYSEPVSEKRVLPTRREEEKDETEVFRVGSSYPCHDHRGRAIRRNPSRRRFQAAKEYEKKNPVKEAIIKVKNPSSSVCDDVGTKAVALTESTFQCQRVFLERSDKVMILFYSSVVWCPFRKPLLQLFDDLAQTVIEMEDPNQIKPARFVVATADCAQESSLCRRWDGVSHRHPSIGWLERGNMKFVSTKLKKLPEKRDFLRFFFPHVPPVPYAKKHSQHQKKKETAVKKERGRGSLAGRGRGRGRHRHRHRHRHSRQQKASPPLAVPKVTNIEGEVDAATKDAALTVVNEHLRYPMVGNASGNNGPGRGSGPVEKGTEEVKQRHSQVDYYELLGQRSNGLREIFFKNGTAKKILRREYQQQRKKLLAASLSSMSGGQRAVGNNNDNSNVEARHRRRRRSGAPGIASNLTRIRKEMKAVRPKISSASGSIASSALPSYNVGTVQKHSSNISKLYAVSGSRKTSKKAAAIGQPLKDEEVSIVRSMQFSFQDGTGVKRRGSSRGNGGSRSGGQQLVLRSSRANGHALIEHQKANPALLGKQVEGSQDARHPRSSSINGPKKVYQIFGGSPRNIGSNAGKRNSSRGVVLRSSKQHGLVVNNPYLATSSMAYGNVTRRFRNGKPNEFDVPAKSPPRKEKTNEELSHVLILTPETFQDTIDGSDSVFCNFFVTLSQSFDGSSPSTTMNSIATWDMFAGNVTHRNLPVTVAAVDCTSYEELCRLSLGRRAASLPRQRWYVRGTPVQDLNKDGEGPNDGASADWTVPDILDFAYEKLSLFG